MANIKYHNLQGRCFGYWKIIKTIPNSNMCIAQCGLCGETYQRDKWSIIHGKSRYCKNCDNKSFVSQTKIRNFKHGQTKTKLHKKWCNIKQRCYDPHTPNYYLYGGRGIKVCPAWESDFVAFRDWALANGYRDDLTIDRIDVSGDYCPENCRWVDNKTQARNRRTNVKYLWLGKEWCLLDLAHELKLDPRTVKRRVSLGLLPDVIRLQKE